MAMLVFLSLLAPQMCLAQQARNALTWGFDTEIETLDPYGTAKGKVQLVIRNVLEHLLVRDTAGKALPALATSWTWVDDKTIDFTLRDGVTFHDGQPFDADDVVYTLDTIKRPGSTVSAQGDYGFIAGIQKIDPTHIRMTLTAPTPSAIDRLTQTLFILPHVAHAKMTPQEFGRKPIGTGPYMVESFEPGRKLELVKNPHYYQAAWGQPRLDRITVLSITDPQTRLAELTSGRVDFVWLLAPDQLEQLKGNKAIDTASGGSTTISFLSLDAAGRSGPNPLQDKNVRLAIGHAINREAISQVLRGGTSVVLDVPCHPLQFGCPKGIAPITYDVEKARAEMKASAYPKGFETKIAAFTEGGPVAEAIIGDLHEIGINAKLDVRETSAWVKDFFGGKLQMAVVPWPSNGVYDVSALVPFFFMSGQGDYLRDPEVTAWFKQASSILDPAERQRLYRLGFAKMADEAAMVPLMTNVTNYAYKRGLDFTPPADGYPLMSMAGWRK